MRYARGASGEGVSEGSWACLNCCAVREGERVERPLGSSVSNARHVRIYYGIVCKKSLHVQVCVHICDWSVHSRQALAHERLCSICLELTDDPVRLEVRSSETGASIDLRSMSRCCKDRS